ncbi:hypothetical protein BO71DRAFT_484539 [Aspergillus ellipticus CBS 707.79]|uniref:Uncharacterized protein n=1 Tax=Aspergillus ellipticus CBS 707.79 TaxID=1448320 RepID=A0A319D8G0_9EURO|nr:hypothetical protein BO71DRAFT_484539 [Aspergillus ellipticus CBS 707.79]
MSGYKMNSINSSYKPGTTTDSSTQSPYHTSTSTQPTAAEPQSDLTHRTDPRVDSDLNNRAQYARGTTTTGNGHPQAPQGISNPPSSTARQATMSSKSTNQAGYNTAPVSGSQTTSGVGYQPTQSSGSTQGTTTTGSKSAQTGEELGRGVKSAAAGIHGAGESLRGGLNAAVDKAFGHEEGATKNAAIARDGEHEIRSGTFGSSQR